MRKRAGRPRLSPRTGPKPQTWSPPNREALPCKVLAPPHFGNISSAVERHYARSSALRVLDFLAPWIACFCGFFGILVISTRLVTGLVSLALCALLLCLPRGGSR